MTRSQLRRMDESGTRIMVRNGAAAICWSTAANSESASPPPGAPGHNQPRSVSLLLVDPKSLPCKCPSAGEARRTRERLGPDLLPELFCIVAAEHPAQLPHHCQLEPGHPLEQHCQLDTGQSLANLTHWTRRRPPGSRAADRCGAVVLAGRGAVWTVPAQALSGAHSVVLCAL